MLKDEWINMCHIHTYTDIYTYIYIYICICSEMLLSNKKKAPLPFVTTWINLLKGIMLSEIC